MDVNEPIHQSDEYTDEYGNQTWMSNGVIHRSDGPAIIYADGSHEWLFHGYVVTSYVHEWMARREVSWPWDEETQMEFVLTWL